MMMIKIKRLRLMTTMTIMTTTAHWSCYPIVHSLMGLPTTPFDFQTPSLAKFWSTTFLFIDDGEDYHLNFKYRGGLPEMTTIILVVKLNANACAAAKTG